MRENGDGLVRGAAFASRDKAAPDDHTPEEESDMSRVRTICNVLCALSLAMAFLPIAPVTKAKAQTVDPCSYGCPKQGCDCPDKEGKPVGK